MQFLVTAYDGTDPEAPTRRRAVREAHLAGARELTEKGHFLIGGALLNDSGEMIGSALVCEFPSRAELDAWLESDPYVTGDVWRTIEVVPFRAAVTAGRKD